MSWVLLILYTAFLHLQPTYEIYFFIFRTIKLWNLEANSNVHTFEGHKDGINSVAFSSDRKYLASGSDDK